MQGGKEPRAPTSFVPWSFLLSGLQNSRRYCWRAALHAAASLSQTPSVHLSVWR